MLEGEWFVFSTCAAECGNVLGPCPKVIGTGPTVLTTTWSCAMEMGSPGARRDGELGGTSVRTTTVPLCGFMWFWVVLCGFMWLNVALCGLMRLYVTLCLFEFDQLLLGLLPLRKGSL